MDRRNFLQTAAGAAAVVAASPVEGLAAPNYKPKKMIGIQLGAVSFTDEGTDRVIEECQKDAFVDTLFVATFTYGRGIAGRQIPGQPLPDHGKQQYDKDTFVGGCYTKYDKKYLTGTTFQDFRAPELGNYDVLEDVIPKAKKHGMKTIAWFEDVVAKNLPGIQPLQDVNLQGEKIGTMNFNAPEHRAWILGLVESWTRDYDLDGIMWGSERQGPFCNALGASHSHPPLSSVCDFSESTIAKARAQGINPERAKQGFTELEAFVTACRKGVRPNDGYYVTLWRLMLRYPELLAWESLWTQSLRETQKAIYDKIKSIKPQMGVGWHVWHNNSFNPIYRAEQDYAEMAPYSDFLKVVIYQNCGGERMVDYVNSVGKTYFGDVPKQELLDFHYRVLDYGPEADMQHLAATGFSPDYVFRETKRAKVDRAGTKTQLWPGIDIDIPTAEGSSKSTPQGTKAVVEAAFHGGADGVILSRKYSEMKLANLRAAGEAVRSLHLV
ncbi:twin-arginine translocation signal domain-containing protein [Terriglobus sp.]|uniref:twin-arginine translocation signal domain-containing protein n=1 Tax=Terriglobus sp. TaxID=1889013 RepID=UPI003AFF6480